MTMAQKGMHTFGINSLAPPAKQARFTPQKGEAMLGTVISFNLAKGFGFIKADTFNQGDVFFSRDSLCPGAPHQLQGCPVKFEMAMHPQTGRPQAFNISPAEVN